MATAARLPFIARHAIHVRKLRGNPTLAEHEFRGTLDALGLAYQFQRTWAHPCYRIADFFLPDHNLIVEIDGAYHDAEADRKKDELFLVVRGIRTIRFTNEEVLSAPEKVCGILCDNLVKAAKGANPAPCVFSKLRGLNGRR